MVYLPAESLDRKQNHMDSLCRKPFFVEGSLGRKREITSWKGVSAGSKRSRTVSAEAKLDGQSLQEANISERVYTLCTPNI